MIKARVNNKYDLTLEEGAVKGLDMIEIKAGIFHVIKDNKSYNAEVLQTNPEEKSFVIRVNGNKYTVQVKDRYDNLLKELGIEGGASAKVKDVKAPMPGLVVDIRVAEGAQVKKGDALVVLQAMKMENILKSPLDGTVKKVNAKNGVAVEKNQVLITFT